MGEDAPRMGERRTGRDQGDGPQANHRLTVAQAAHRLGITKGAVRSRIKRGTLATVKEAGRVYVVWIGGTSGANHAPHTDEPTGAPSDQRELIEDLRDHITELRQQLASEREANRENRRLLAAALERIPAIEASPAPEPRGSRESVAQDEPGTNTPPDQAEPETAAQPRSWWRRLIGG